MRPCMCVCGGGGGGGCAGMRLRKKRKCYWRNFCIVSPTPCPSHTALSRPYAIHEIKKENKLLLQQILYS